MSLAFFCASEATPRFQHARRHVILSVIAKNQVGFETTVTEKHKTLVAKQCAWRTINQCAKRKKKVGIMCTIL